jgi:hypothetical protein
MVERRSGDRPEPKPKVVTEKQAKPETRRVQLDLSQRTFERFVNLQNQTGGSRREVANSGLALVEWVVDHVKPGDPVKLKDKDGNWQTLYFPWHWAR